jgi:hypothetical protein
MTIIELSPTMTELFPAIMGLLVAAGGLGLAKYTQYVCRRDQARNARMVDPAE